MQIKTARPLPPTPTTTPSTSPQKTAPAQQATPVEQKAAPSKPLPRPPQANSAVKTPVLASPEEQVKVERHIENTSPEKIVQNASRLPSLSLLGNPALSAHTPPQGSVEIMGSVQQQLQKNHQNNLQLSSLNYQIAEKLPQPEKDNFKALAQLRDKHMSAEFSRQMQFSAVLVMPGQVQLPQRMSMASTHQQARLREAEEVLNLKTSQANQDPDKISQALQEHQQQLKEVTLLFQAEIVTGDGVSALVQGRPFHNANRMTLGNHHLEKSHAIQQQKMELNSATLPLQDQIRDLTSEIQGLKEQVGDESEKIVPLQYHIDGFKYHIDGLKSEIENISEHIEDLKEDPKMSSIQLKNLMRRKDEKEVLLSQILSKEEAETPLIQDKINTLETGVSLKAERISNLEGRLKELEQELEGMTELNTLKKKQLELALQGKHMLMQANHMLSPLA